MDCENSLKGLKKGIAIPQKALTHTGKFHADDVFSTAFLKLINPEIEIVRSFTIPEDFDGLVFDIGGGSFDHHQEGAEVRENGIPYAAFGLLWREFASDWFAEGDDDAGNSDMIYYDESFVQPLDLSDNTGKSNSLSEAVELFNLCWDEERELSGNDDPRRRQSFYKAVDFATLVLTNLKKQALANRKARKIIVSSLDNTDGGIVVLPEYIPWKSTLSGNDKGYLFVVYPSQRGGFSGQHIPQLNEKGEKFYYYFPKEWRGKSSEELACVSGIETLHFCHNSGFLISAGTLEDAISACNTAIKRGEIDF